MAGDFKPKPTKTDREFKRKLSQLQKKDWDGFVTSTTSIAVDHFFEGIRCNGFQEKASILKSLQELKSNIDHIEGELMPCLDRAKKFLAEFPYRLCPECKGAKGQRFRGPRRHGSADLSYIDCPECDGLGFFWKNN